MSKPAQQKLYRLPLAIYLKQVADELEGVLTIQECMQMFGVTQAQIEYAILYQALVARKTEANSMGNNRITLISRVSAASIWGKKVDNYERTNKLEQGKFSGMDDISSSDPDDTDGNASSA